MDPERAQNRISRRRMLKRIGAGAAVAWSAPVLSSLRTPAFAQYPSVCGNPPCTVAVPGCGPGDGVPCGPFAASCGCLTTTENECFCINQGTCICAQTCTASADCPDGQRCIPGTVCGPVCVAGCGTCTCEPRARAAGPRLLDV
jgi:hypothetical protein